MAGVLCRLRGSLPASCFATPEIRAVGRKLAPTAEIMGFSADQIHRHAAARVKMSGVGLAVRVDGNQHPFALRSPLKDALSVRQHNGTEAAVIQRLRGLLRIGKLSDEFRQLILQRLLKAGTKRRIPVALVPLRAPFASIIDTGDPRHGEHQRIDQRQMPWFLQHARDAGDIVVIRPGMSIPVDGVITEGNGYLDQSAITGESIPVEKGEGDTVISATINKNGSFRFRASRVGDDTTLAQIIRLVDEAGNSKAPIARLADRVSGVFVPAVIVIAILTAVVWLAAGAGFEFALSCAISVLVISCPCALGLATPVAIMVGTGKAAEYGILIKSAESLENLHSIDTIVLDKTGTITSGHPSVTDILLLDDRFEKEALQEGISPEKWFLAQAAAAEAGEAPFLVALDGITDPHNLGAIIRSAETAGAHGVIIPKRRAVGLTAVVARASAGALAHMPVHKTVNLAALLDTLKERGVWIFGAEADGTVDLYDAGFAGPTALVIGSEGEGISRLVRQKCDFIVSIPMRGKVNSLNASNAAAVLLFEAVRRRTCGK